MHDPADEVPVVCQSSATRAFGTGQHRTDAKGPGVHSCFGPSTVESVNAIFIIFGCYSESKEKLLDKYLSFGWSSHFPKKGLKARRGPRGTDDASGMITKLASLEGRLLTQH